MLELHVQSGPDQGKVLRVASSPAVIGRNPANAAVLEGPGIWDRHAEVSLSEDGRFHIRMLGDATGSRASRHEASWMLRNGEPFHLGGVRLCFGLGPGRQRPQRPSEILAWVVLALVLTVEAWLALRS